MNNNQLKIIACVSMFIDHLGMLIFPQFEIFRLLGRIAMPIFAFFIAEGCRYTHNRLKYFLQIFILGVICQIPYTGLDIINGNFTELYFNILITFSFSIVICYFYIDFEKAFKAKDNKNSLKFGGLFLLSIVVSYSFLRFTDNILGFPVTVDYGIRGILLPVSAVLFTDKQKRLFSFSVCLIGFLIYFNKPLNTIIFSSIAILLLFFYNGKRGSKKLKYLFYIFYPSHLALLYLISCFVH